MSNVKARISFDQIYKENYKGAYNFVKSNVHDDSVAEDIVADCLIKLWHNIAEKQNSDIKPLLFTYLRNASLDHLRHQAVVQNSLKNIHENLKIELEMRISLLQSYDPEHIFSKEIKKIFNDTLKNLSPKTRRVIELSRIEFLSNKEIAKKLGISVKGVDYHIAIALKKLRQELSDYLPLIFFL